jgi:adenylate kinase family enzyme
MIYRIHTVGGSGSGTTTLAKALAEKLRSPHFDSDDYYWEPTNPPFTTKRSVEKRLELLHKDLAQHESWALSGSLVSWGESIFPQLTHIVFLDIPPAVRMARLRERERARHGNRIDPGGDMHKIHTDFIEWAMRYDTAGLEQRSKKMHEEWLKQFNCPVIRIQEALPVDQLVKLVIK